MLAAGLRCPLLAVRGRACGSCECLLGWGSGGGALPGVTGGARLPDGLGGGLDSARRGGRLLSSVSFCRAEESVTLLSRQLN